MHPMFGGKHVEAYRNQDTVGREPNSSVSSAPMPSPHIRLEFRGSLIAREALPGPAVSTKGRGPGKVKSSGPALRSGLSLVSSQASPHGGADQSARLSNQQSVFLYKFFRFDQSMPSSGWRN